MSTETLSTDHQKINIVETSADASELFAAALIFATLIFWFNPYLNVPIRGDDINLFNELRGSAPIDFVFSTTAEKFRPVFNLVASIVYFLCGEQFARWVNINLVLHCFSALVFFRIALNLRASIWVATCIALTIATSRFAYVNIWLASVGLLESLALLQLSGILFFIERYLRLGDRSDNTRALAIFFLLAFTHERFLVLALPLAVYPILSSFKDYGRTLRFNSIFCIAIVAGNVLIKYFLGIGFFVGTGGTVIDGNIVESLSNNIPSATLNLLGWSSGPSYLMIEDALVAKPQIRLLSALLVACSLVALAPISQCFNLCDARKKELRLLVLLGLSMLLLILAASVTFRLEARWLLTPFSLFIFILYISTMFLTKYHARLFLSIFFCAAILQNIYYRTKVEDNLYIGAWLERLIPESSSAPPLATTAPAITELGPSTGRVGVGFNLQPDGSSAMWVRVEPGTLEPQRGSVRVLIGGVWVDAATYQDYVTFSVPLAIINARGEFPIVLHQPKTGIFWAPALFRNE
jgi:hypothetical protein